MPNWKKVVVSGSDASLNSLLVTGGITGSLLGTASTASYVDLVAGPNITINQVGTSFEISGSGGVDTNFANTDLTFTGTRTHDLSGNSLSLLNGSSITLSGSGTFNQILLKHDTNTLSLQSARTALNAGNADIDFRVGSVGTDYALNVDGGTDRVSINKNLPNATLDVNGDTIITGSVNVLNGNINLDANAYFLQGTDTGGTNVSLIGVNSSDQIYIGNQGLTNIIADDTIISGSLEVSGSLILPTLSESAANALVSYNTSSKEVFYTNDPTLNSLTVNNNINVGGDLVITGSLIYDASITTFTRRITTPTASVTDADYRLGIRYTQTGSVQILLPKISDVGERDLRFKDEEGNADLNNITIVASGSDLIDGDSTAILDRNYIAIGLYNDGTSNWYIE